MWNVSLPGFLSLLMTRFLQEQKEMLIAHGLDQLSPSWAGIPEDHLHENQALH
jgi:hypothetical protein